MNCESLIHKLGCLKPRTTCDLLNVIDHIVRKKCLTKVLMDGGSGLNILYVDTLDAMHIP